MSYDLDLLDPITKEVIEFDFKHDLRGGTYAVGGTNEAHLNITYNYSKFFYDLIDKEKGIRYLYGKTGAEAIGILQEAISKLADDVDPDYWKATEGNAKSALLKLVALSQLRPDGIWDGD